MNHCEVVCAACNLGVCREWNNSVVEIVFKAKKERNFFLKKKEIIFSAANPHACSHKN
jgi:hypothetical protein